MAAAVSINVVNIYLSEYCRFSFTLYSYVDTLYSSSYRALDLLAARILSFCLTQPLRPSSVCALSGRVDKWILLTSGRSERVRADSFQDWHCQVGCTFNKSVRKHSKGHTSFEPVTNWPCIYRTGISLHFIEWTFEFSPIYNLFHFWNSKMTTAHWIRHFLRFSSSVINSVKEKTKKNCNSKRCSFISRNALHN